MYVFLLGLLVVAAAALILWGAIRFVPRYAVLPIILTFAINGVAYYLPKLLSTGAAPIYMGLWLDEALPLCPVFIWIYVGAFLQWFANWGMLSRQERGFMNRRLAGEWVSKLLCSVCFMLLPTALTHRPSPETNTLSGYVTALVFALDTPENLFPSIHCLESWLCLRNAFSMKNVSKGYKWGMAIFSLLVMVSTLLVKQHVLLDIPAGILMAEIGLLVSKYMRKTPLLDKIEEPFLKETK